MKTNWCHFKLHDFPQAGLQKCRNIHFRYSSHVPKRECLIHSCSRSSRQQRSSRSYHHVQCGALVDVNSIDIRRGTDKECRHVDVTSRRSQHQRRPVSKTAQNIIHSRHGRHCSHCTLVSHELDQRNICRQQNNNASHKIFGHLMMQRHGNYQYSLN